MQINARSVSDIREASLSLSYSMNIVVEDLRRLGLLGTGRSDLVMQDRGGVNSALNTLLKHVEMIEAN